MNDDQAIADMAARFDALILLWNRARQVSGN
jgi:myo-inositol catabolism protein IolC